MPIKGTVYTGVIFMPHHPDADMHGNLRAVIRTKSFLCVMHTLERYGVSIRISELDRIWHASRSVIEQAVCSRDYGVVFCAPLPMSYLGAVMYHRMPRNLLSKKRIEKE